MYTVCQKNIHQRSSDRNPYITFTAHRLPFFFFVGGEGGGGGGGGEERGRDFYPGSALTACICLPEKANRNSDSLPL